MKIQDIQFFPSKTASKATLWISIVLMSFVWLCLATVLALISLEAFALLVSWNILSLVFVGFLFVVVAYLIPLQLIRYVRKLRALP
jgi:membrane protein YdbS with pleckstrin-like domain